eukprot:11723-Amphidinium_carterae.1
MHMKKLEALDKHFLVDYELLKSVTGTQGAETLKRRFLSDCVPNASSPTLAVSVAVVKSQSLLDSPACKWSSVTLKSELATAHS